MVKMAETMTLFYSALIQVEDNNVLPSLRARLDSTLFRQVLTNIVRNGVEANPERHVRFRIQIDAISNLPGMKVRKAGRIIAWFYGGTEHAWRFFLARKVGAKKMPKEVEELLAQFGKK